MHDSNSRKYKIKKVNNNDKKLNEERVRRLKQDGALGQQTSVSLLEKKPAETTILPSKNEIGPWHNFVCTNYIFFLHDNGQVPYIFILTRTTLLQS